jgi:hypothetical protein
MLLLIGVRDGRRIPVTNQSTVSRDTTLFESAIRHGDMKSAVLLLSISIALFLGFGISFVVAPDPTGVLPMAVGIVLTGLLSSVFYVGLQRRLILDKSST